MADDKITDLQTAFDAFGDILKGYVDRSLDHYASRIEALEKQVEEMKSDRSKSLNLDRVNSSMQSTGSL
ncbi:hypothetical protein [Oricola sp.]|uniref:hypothetical protein n=1 Tax=Oricola sp. TaxID=1979950 RepID=UPI0025E27A15|nr:hypothetical protein [Oricola sp.]MCI5073954.1 hypothetical protein [Oricola sp.]